MRGIVWSLALIAGLLVGANFYYGSMNGGGVTPASDEPAGDAAMPESAPEPMPEPMSETPMLDPVPEPTPSAPMTDEPPADVDAPMVDPDLGDMAPDEGSMVDPAAEPGAANGDADVTIDTPSADDIGASIMEDAAEAAAEATGDSAEPSTSAPIE